ncbi:hypothetical protein Fcan01_08817 [Folsomia candida]|uniref:Uncharacterized protein n=1 Tax=Folsomia candida TaxID=158441 RepID=A0A226EFC9_FOLCA|nr:hypothetical protein Fcan01_08817 [Folsomia candida]
MSYYSYPPPTNYPVQDVAGGQVPIQSGTQAAVYPATSNMGFGQSPPNYAAGSYNPCPYGYDYVEVAPPPVYFDHSDRAGRSICLNVFVTVVVVLLIGVVIVFIVLAARGGPISCGGGSGYHTIGSGTGYRYRYYSSYKSPTRYYTCCKKG